MAKRSPGVEPSRLSLSEAGWRVAFPDRRWDALKWSNRSCWLHTVVRRRLSAARTAWLEAGREGAVFERLESASLIADGLQQGALEIIHDWRDRPDFKGLVKAIVACTSRHEATGERLNEACDKLQEAWRQGFVRLFKEGNELDPSLAEQQYRIAWRLSGQRNASPGQATPEELRLRYGPWTGGGQVVSFYLHDGQAQRKQPSWVQPHVQVDRPSFESWLEHETRRRLVQHTSRKPRKQVHDDVFNQWYDGHILAFRNQHGKAPTEAEDAEAGRRKFGEKFRRNQLRKARRRHPGLFKQGPRQSNLPAQTSCEPHGRSPSQVGPECLENGGADAERKSAEK
jgi:hypothetical protein